MVALNAIRRLALKARSTSTLSFRAKPRNGVPSQLAGWGEKNPRISTLTGAVPLTPSMTPSEAHSTPESGFTLIELVIVMTIIGLLAAIAVPMYVQSVRNAREAVLKEDLRTLRSSIDAYTVDKQKAPQSLDDLVQAGYLKALPQDPFTHRTDTWVPSQDDAMMSLDQTESGINDVHSGAQGTAGDGTSYSSW